MGTGREDCCLSFPQHSKTPRSWACCSHHPEKQSHPAAPAAVETREEDAGLAVPLEVKLDHLGNCAACGAYVGEPDPATALQEGKGT